MRCFVALDMPIKIKESVGDMIEQIRGSAKGVRWVPPANLHLTLKFLGEVNEERIPGIKAALSGAVAQCSCFSITVRGTGVFPNSKRPTVLWIGMEAPEELLKLYRDIDDAMAGFGFEKESRAFSPHLTIGRVKDGRGIEPLIRELDKCRGTSFGSMEVREVLLMKSELRREGAEYSKVGVFKLPVC